MSARPANANAPLRMIGRPPLLVGALEIANDGSDRVALGRHTPSLQGPSGARVEARLRFVGGVRGKARTRVPVHLLVDAATPPGVYHTEIDVGGKRHPVEARVLERPGVTVRPSLVRLTAAAGAEIEADLIVHNSGNVAHTLGRRAVVFFEEAYWVGRALVFALREADADEGVQRYLDRVVHELRTTMGPTTTVHLHPESEHLAAGQETLVRLTATLPVELAKGRTYVAFFSYAGADVRIEIAVNGAANSTKRRPA